MVTLLVEDSTRIASIAIDHDARINKNYDAEKAREFIGFISIRSLWCVYIFHFVMIANLLVKVCVQTRGTSPIVARIQSSTLSRLLLEIGLVSGWGRSHRVWICVVPL